MRPPVPRTVAEMWATVVSIMASFMFVWAIIGQYCPYELRCYLEKFSYRIKSYFDPYIRLSVHEYNGSQMQQNEMYTAVKAYLSTKSNSAKRLKAEAGRGGKIIISPDENEKVTDEFRGVKVRWASGKIAQPQGPTGYFAQPERRYYRLTFHKQYRQMITETYLEHVMMKGKELKSSNRRKKLFTNCPKWTGHKPTMWSHIPFRHPATFQTMAMEPDKKQEIMDDLLTFSRSKEFYAEIGKAWKRGYLLYGPPGTGKSTMIAAMANLLDYDVYDLELTAVKDNTELRKLLIEITSKSILVIEDIDCSLDLTGQRKKAEKSTEDKNEQGKKEVSKKEQKEDSTGKVTLSGLLNFIDGLWSASGGERIIVFTTNYVEKLDPALIRRGRMDKHIELPYCSFEGFKVLAKNYLKVKEHPMFETIERLLQEANITPADVAENLIPKSLKDDPIKSLSNLIQFLEEAKEKTSMIKDEMSLTVKNLQVINP